MDSTSQASKKAALLVTKGAYIPDPASVHIGEDVDPDRISGTDVAIFPGCRIYGERTVISAGCTLGADEPVTIRDCRLGPGVSLKGGSFTSSVFLDDASMGAGAQVREACLLEEQANGAHCVGLKQTILFPFVTLGSLINFCDCLMAGGTSRKDHSEVGSSYVHFNYTPDGDKTTPSLFGDVPRGVMLDRPPIFLGGQGGAVGPLRVNYGTVVAAGSILREDVLEPNQLVFASQPENSRQPREAKTYKNLTRVLRNNLIYLANLVALEQWYLNVRRPFFATQEFGAFLYEGALEVLAAAKEERSKRLAAMAAKVPPRSESSAAFCEHVDELCALFISQELPRATGFLEPASLSKAAARSNYLETIRGLAPGTRAAGVEWLDDIVHTLCAKAGELLRPLEVFSPDR